MGCSSCGGVKGFSAYVPGTSRSYITTTGRVLGQSQTLGGHFGSYVPATERSYITTSGRTESIPNATGGMHVGIQSRAGMGTIFGDGQTNWIEGIANEYVVAAGALLVLLMVMK